MIEIIIASVSAVVGFVGGWKYREIVAQRQMAAIRKAVAQYLHEQAEDVSKRTIEIVVRREGEQFFVYNKETDEFLAQGTTHQQISDALNSRFPGKIFVANKEDLKEMGYQHESL